MSSIRTNILLGSAAVILLTSSGGAFAQTAADYTGSAEDDQIRRPVKAESVAPLTSRFVLNGESLDYSSKGALAFGMTDGSESDAKAIGSATLTLSNTLHEGTNSGVFHRNQTGWYLQFGQIDRQREISVTQKQATDIIGFKLQLSVTGNCLFPESEPGSLCTYTPALATDPAAYDPATLIPTRFVESGSAGATISQETYDALQADGWQRGVAGGTEIVGLDMDIPNSGSIGSTERANENGIDRHEEVKTRGVLTLSKFTQNLYSNADEAALDRTVRGFVLLDSDEWSRKAVGIQALAWILPGMNAKLDVSGDPNMRIGNNLFYAANNQWTPRDSFTVFQTGAGSVEHMTSPPRDVWDTPASWFNGFWMGFTPVRTISNTSSVSYVPVGSRDTTDGPLFVQTGLSSEIAFSDSAITIIDDISGQISQLQLSQIDNLFVQYGLELTSQAALAYATNTETSYYSLKPNIAFTGNRTGGTSVFRYYAGAILDDKTNGYVGLDYSTVTRNGYQFSGRGEFYSEATRDNYSFAEMRLNKSNTFGDGKKVTLGFSARKAFDRPTTVLDKFDSLSRDSVFDLLARYESTGPMSFDLRHRISDSDDQKSESTTVGFAYQTSDRFSLTGQITPFSSEESYIRSRAGFSWRIAEAATAGTLQVQIADIKYDYGEDSVGVALETSEKTLLASFQVKF